MKIYTTITETGQVETHQIIASDTPLGVNVPLLIGKVRHTHILSPEFLAHYGAKYSVNLRPDNGAQPIDLMQKFETQPNDLMQEKIKAKKGATQKRGAPKGRAKRS